MTLSDLRTWLVALAEVEATVPARVVLDRLPDSEAAGPAAGPVLVEERDPTTWRERLWTAPAETRIGREELLEALGRPRSWLYRHTGPAAEDRIPHRKLDGQLMFVVGEVRAWIREHEESEVEGPMESTPAERRIGIEGGR